MQSYEKQFLFLLKCYLNNEKLPDGYRFDVGRVFSLAAKHNILPVVFEKACETEADISEYKRIVFRLCANQIGKNVAFEELFGLILDEKINVIVVKGPVCAACYKNSDMRLSSDFDIIVSPDHRSRLHELLILNGFVKKNDAYISEKTGLYLEVSTELGEGSDRQKQIVNETFYGFLYRTVMLSKYRTLMPTEHIAYLIYHAYKHFIGSGFGIKQIVDIYLFAVKFFDEIDFEELLQILNKLKILNFAHNVFYLIQKVFDFDFSFILKNADNDILCSEEFLSDLLHAGVFGKSSEDRLHSASVVLDAVENSGKKSVLKSIFPPMSEMQKKFEILKKIPFLLLLFWIYRLFEYAIKMIFSKNKVSPQKSIEIADQRIDLMKKMGII